MLFCPEVYSLSLSVCGWVRALFTAHSPNKLGHPMDTLCLCHKLPFPESLMLHSFLQTAIQFAPWLSARVCQCEGPFNINTAKADDFLLCEIPPVSLR